MREGTIGSGRSCWAKLLKLFIWAGVLLLLLIAVRGYLAFRDRHPGYSLNLMVDPAKATAEPRLLRAGFARVNINPDLRDSKKPVWLAGFSQNRAATGIHDDLWATAFVLDDGHSRVGVVSLDAIGFFNDDVLKVRENVSAVAKLDYAIVCSTHNHSTPDLMGLWGPNMFVSGVRHEYREKVIQASSDALTAAISNMVPARVAFREIPVSPQNLLTDTRKPIVYDSDVRVMHFIDAQDSRTLGTLVGWGNHPETVWSQNTEVTSDYCGYLRDALRDGLPGNAAWKGLGGTHVFINGAVGGLMSTTPSVEVQDPVSGEQLKKACHDKARAVGRQIAARVLERLNQADTNGFTDHLPLGVRARSVDVQLDNDMYLLAGYFGLLDRGYSGWRKLRTEVALVTLGQDASIACVPGEIYPEIVNGGVESPEGADFPGAPVEVPPIREMMPGKVKFVFGLANDEIGYLIPRTEWNRKAPHIYGQENAPYGEINSVGVDAAATIHAAFRGLCGKSQPAVSSSPGPSGVPAASGLSFRRAPIEGSSAAAPVNPSPADPYLWLEDVTGEKALSWVRQQNAQSTKELEASPEFEPIRKGLLAIYDSKEKIPYAGKRGQYLYNFWRDDQHVKGLWRRTSLEEYKKSSPKWETVLDIDELAAREKENWVYKGAEFLEPTFDRCLLMLSRAGADAVVIREFDVVKKEFVSGGFYLKEAKSDVAWRNRDTLYVGTDFGSGSMTSSGYPRIVKEWRRGETLEKAETVFEGKTEDVSVSAQVKHDHGRIYEWIQRGTTFFTTEQYLRRGDKWVKLEKPADVQVATFEDQFLFWPRLDWKVGGMTYKGGSLLATDVDSYLNGERRMQVLFAPQARTSLVGWSETKSCLLLNELDNVRSRPYQMERRGKEWMRTAIPAPDFGSVSVSGVDPDGDDLYWMTVEDFLTPSTLHLGTVGKLEHQKLKSLPRFFNAEGLEISQHEAVSRDGTHIPYFQVSRKGIALDGKNPTLLRGYGGFNISMQPSYNAGLGLAWLEKGGVMALANIRGGGEFGPAWHEAARKENRQRAYDDFIAIAEHLISRKVTSPEHLGISGGSNGGLLMGVMFTQRPDLFKAVVCQVPLLDMRRYNVLLAGASWMDEYGNPDKPQDWAYISKYSPYQNVVAGKKYPRILFTTSTRDDRVHPGHARKMVARMKEQGHDVLYYENIEGGHGGAADNKQAAYMGALANAFLLKELR